MSRASSNFAFAVCLTILSGSIGAAFGRRYCGCETVVRPDDHSSSSLGAASDELVRPANPELSGDVMVREAASTTSAVTRSERAASTMLEAQVARLQSELGATRFASMLVATAPPERPTTLVHVMLLMEHSDLTKNEELREMFVREVRPDAALDLIRAEPKLRAALHAAYSKGTPEWRQFEWPPHRDRLVQDFVLRLSDAGLSGRTIEHYRAAIADYL
ncbi:MAG: hypothetical protein IPK26_20995 [Planctomycetes bacterium]|nr:hypothetical protein [Planctomycetota bacterium]